jgi:hypothetical protein
MRQYDSDKQDVEMVMAADMTWDSCYSFKKSTRTHTLLYPHDSRCCSVRETCMSPTTRSSFQSGPCPCQQPASSTVIMSHNPIETAVGTMVENGSGLIDGRLRGGGLKEGERVATRARRISSRSKETSASISRVAQVRIRIASAPLSDRRA